MMWMGTFDKNKTLQFVFLSLWILCGLSAIYLAMAEVLEEAHGKKILPY